jgi:hypothetical protein
MFKLKSRLLVVILVVGSLTVLLSCSQKDDITAPKSLTKVWLSPQRLPTAIDGMIYELWASKVPYTSIAEPSQVHSLGRFSHVVSDTLVGFLDENGAVRADSNEFSIEGDLFDYAYLFVAVEPQEVDPAGDGLPGPLLVGQTITGNTDTIRMYFPQQDSLWNSTIRCNFETPTDDNPYFDGFGLWWCNHTTENVTIIDTLSATVTYRDSTIIPIISPLTGDTLNLVDLRKAYPDSVWYIFDTILMDFGRDTLALGIDSVIHYGAKQMVIRKAGTEVPRIIHVPTVDLDTAPSVVSLDIFSQDLYGLPDLSAYGWKYKGWVVSNYIPRAAIGSFTPPAWDFTTGEVLIPGYQGGLLTTGTFSNEEDRDDADPFTLNVNWEVDSTFYDTVTTDPLVVDTVIERFTVLKRPRFPGEDFLNVPALRAATNNVITSTPYILTRPGSVFISLEPSNMVTDTTNFPLIPFVRSLPPGASNIWTLINMAGVADGAPGLPKMEAKIRRY